MAFNVGPLSYISTSIAHLSNASGRLEEERPGKLSCDVQGKGKISLSAILCCGLSDWASSCIPNPRQHSIVHCAIYLPYTYLRTESIKVFCGSSFIHWIVSLYPHPLGQPIEGVHVLCSVSTALYTS